MRFANAQTVGFRSTHRSLQRALVIAGAVLALAAVEGAHALVMVTDPDDGSPFFRLDRPTGQFDETGLSGFELLVSSRTGQFRANDQYLIAGEETLPETSIAADLGAVEDLSDRPLAFSIAHELSGGRRFTFRTTDLGSQASSVLCWGVGCPQGSIATELLDGMPPIVDFNGLQIQARAQDVPGASAALAITSLTGVEVGGAEFFDEVVAPDSPGTVLPQDLGRRGQWMLADSLDLVLSEWELTGIVTLTRPDEALTDLTKVRLAVDLVRDPTLPVVPLPEGPSSLLGVSCLLALAASRGFRGRR